jgi:hypothetical protein
MRTLPSACLWLVLCTAGCGGERKTGPWTAIAWKQTQPQERHPNDVMLSLAATAQLRTDARVW